MNELSRTTVMALGAAAARRAPSVAPARAPAVTVRKSRRVVMRASGGRSMGHSTWAGAGVVGGEREEPLVEPVHRLAGVVLVHHRAQELDPGVDVRLDLRDVAHGHVAAGRRHDLHDADRAGGAPRVLIELRFLIALSHEHEVIDVVAVTVLLEQLDGPLEFRQLLTGGGRL